VTGQAHLAATARRIAGAADDLAAAVADVGYHTTWGSDGRAAAWTDVAAAAGRIRADLDLIDQARTQEATP